MKKFCFLVLVLFLMLAVVSAQAVGLDVPKRTEYDIASFIASHPSTMPSDIYETIPVTEGPDYDPGSLRNEALTAALNAVNQVRFVAGIPSNVVLNSSYTQECQAGALINAVNNVLSHNPVKPEDMSQELFDLGNKGTSSSNLACGFNTLSNAVFYGWMNDGDSGNISRIGHRRWVLDPRMTETGFGMVGMYSAMYSFGSEWGSDYPETVAWPAQTMPVRWMSADLPWNVSFKSGIPAASGVRVTLVRREDQKTWYFSESEKDNGYFNIDNGGYGAGTAVIFRPKDIQYSAGDIFDVKIEGAAAGTLEYSVELYSFSIDQTKVSDIEPQVYTGSEIKPIVTVSMGSKVLKEDTDYTLFYNDNINAGENASVTITGQGYYTGSVTVPFSILPAPITAAAFDDLPPAVYTGKPLSGFVCARFGEQQLTEGMEYTVEWSDCINAGTATATVTGIGNFTGETTLSMEILRREIYECTVEIPPDQFDPGTGFVPQVTVKYDDILLKADTDYTVRAELREDSTDGKVILTGIGNLCGERTEDISVTLDFKAGGLCYTRTGSNAVFTGPAKKTVSSLVIPDTVSYAGQTYRVTEIGISACKGLKKLSKVTIGGSVTAVGTSAFASCPKLSTVKFGSKVATIGGGSFENCSVLKSVTLPSSVKSIGNKAFAGCKKLSSVKLSTKLHTVGDSAFLGDTALKNITMPSAVKNIGKKAFANCKNLKKIIIQTKKLTKSTIGTSAFKGIYARAVVTCPKGKVKAYTTLLRSKGMGSKVTFR